MKAVLQGKLLPLTTQVSVLKGAIDKANARVTSALKEYFDRARPDLVPNVERVFDAFVQVDRRHGDPARAGGVSSALLLTRAQGLAHFPLLHERQRIVDVL